MRIALIRHLKVDCPKSPFWMTSGQFMAWSKRYDDAPVLQHEIDLQGLTFERFFVSPLPRTLATVKRLTQDYTVSPYLFEVPLYPFVRTKRLKLPFPIWRLFGRLAWLVSAKSQRESKKLSEQRAEAFLKEHIDPLSNGDIAIVTHGFFALVLAKHLLRRGFRGPRYKALGNGRLSLFQKP